jgi:spermidine/putrescine transport system permease protein
MSDSTIPASAPATPAAPSAPSVSLPSARTMGGKAKRAVDRSSALVEFWLRAHTGLVFLFLYLPIVVVVIFSFNDTHRRVTDWDGFGLRWYEYVLSNREVQRYLLNSVIVGLASAIIATVVGTMAALGLQRAPKWFRLPFDALTYISVIVPELVIALATLVFFASTIGRDGVISQALGTEIGFGYHTIVGAVSLFNISLVLLLVRARLSGMDRTMVEASFDLFATPWRTFWQITFPQLLPAIVAGFLLSFTFAFDDYLITTFVNGRGTSTIPLYVFGQIRKGVTPATNAVAAIMLFVTLGILLVGQYILIRQARKQSGRRGSGVAGMVADQGGG